jgi:tetratricopeptide (TPR) repeat protein
VLIRYVLITALLTLTAQGTQEDISRHIAPLERALKTSADPGLVTYEIARTYAAAGQSAPAIKWLRKVVALNQDFDPTGDEAFDAMRSTPDFRSLLSDIEKATPPVRLSRPAFNIADPDLIPEGMAYDPAGRRFFLGKLLKEL